MTSRERMTAILAGEAPDHMAVYEHYWPETIRDFWTKQGYPEGKSPQEVFDYDIVNLGWSVNTVPFMRDPELVEETDQHRLMRDGRGALLRTWQGKSGTPEHVDFECKTREAWEQKYRDQLLGIQPDRIGAEHLRKQLPLQREGDKFLVMGNLFVFELMRGIMGDVAMMESMLLDPDWIHDFCRVYTDLFCTHYAWIFDNIGKPDAMWIYEDLGYTNGPWCSPAVYGALVQPYHQELVDLFKSYGLPVILHTCGDVRKLFGQIMATGWDCLQPMEAKAGCNVLEFADQMADHGRRIGFMGNIDVTVLNTGDRDKIRAEVERKTKGMAERRAAYCFHSDHSIPPDVSYADYQFALEVFREHWSYA